jgi:hypothetical protein
MTGSSVAGVITAVATIITALGGFVLAIGVLLPILRETREQKKQINQVHTIVNQQRTDMMRYQRTLVHTLKNAGIEVPLDQSIEISEDIKEK